MINKKIALKLPLNFKEDFAQISKDYNPIHTSEEFAQTTFLGGTVAHGLGVFLRTIETLDISLPSIQQLTINFHKAIKDLTYTYTLDIEVVNNQYLIRILKGSTLYIEFKIQTSTEVYSSTKEFYYWLSKFCASFQNNKSILILNIEIEFKSQQSFSEKYFHYSSESHIKNIFDVNISTNITNNLFVRLSNLESDVLDSFKEKHLDMNKYPKLKGKNILITGGKRGLGSVLTKELKMISKNIFHTTRSPEDVEDKKSFNVDFLKQKDLEEFKRNLDSHQFDIIILNAFAPIQQFEEGELTKEEEEVISKRYYDITYNSYILLIKLYPDAIFFNISTSLKLEDNERLKLYVKAKQELEKNLINVYHIQCPRFLSDQTNHFMLNPSIDSTFTSAQKVLNTIERII